MEDPLLTDYLGLVHHEAFSAGILARTLGELGSLSSLRLMRAEVLREAGFGKRQIAALLSKGLFHSRSRKAEADLAWSARPGRSIIHFESPLYPVLLREIAAPPPVLYVEGEASCLNDACLALVGSRRCTSYGRRHAHWLAHELSRAGLLIGSGMALGIDAAAHQGALAAGGRTVAVLGAGVDVCYPARNRELREQIRCQGALVSEFPPGTPPARANFPRRNRIISGLAVGVVVVEASLRSGSLVTAKLALQQNREVFAMPGPISSPVSQGCHQLLRQGAALVASVEDVARELPGIIAAAKNESDAMQAAAAGRHPGLAPENATLLAALDESGSLPETLAVKTGLSPQQLAVQLLELELSGAITSKGGRHFRA